MLRLLINPFTACCPSATQRSASREGKDGREDLRQLSGWAMAEQAERSVVALGDPGMRWVEWSSWARERPATWARIVAQFTSAAGSETASEDERVLQHVCHECERGSLTTKALATRRMRVHRHRKPVAGIIDAGSKERPSCKRMFGTHRQLLDHAQYRSKRCRSFLLDTAADGRDAAQASSSGDSVLQ